MEIFRSMCEKNGYTLGDETAQYAAQYFSELYENRDENFGNARDARNFFERSVACQSDRVAALEAVEVRLEDHIIVADHDFVSFSESGYLM